MMFKVNCENKVHKRLSGLIKAAAVLAEALVLVVSGIIGSDERIRASEKPQVKVGAVTINGTAGTPINEQAITLTIENGKFDTAQFYIGRDLSDFFTYNCLYYGASRLYFTNDSYSDTNYHKPVGLKVIITKTGETEIICKVTGTPLSPSKSDIKVYLLPSMLLDYKTTSDGFVSFDSTAAKWDIKPANGKWENMSINIDTDLSDKLGGVAGESEFDVDFTISVKNGIFVKDVPKDTDVTNWFSYHNSECLLPVGLKAKLTSDIKIGDTSCSLKLYGTPTYSSQNILKAQIPIEYIAGIYSSYSDTHYYCHSPNHDEDYNTTTNTYRFAITGDENESPYLAAYADDVIVCAGHQYGSNTIRVYFSVNGNTLEPSKDSLKNLQNSWLYSNQDGILDKSAPGFLYSPGNSNSNIQVNDITTMYSRYGFYMNITGTFRNLGVYDISYFLPQKMLTGNDSDEGFTPVVKNGHLIVKQPFELEIENTEISAKVGSTLETYITVRPSYKAICRKLDEEITTETLKYTVSDKLKSTGLNLTPVCVNEDFVIFKLSGMITGRPATINLADCVTLSYENVKKDNYYIPLEDVWKGLGNISINENNYATLTILPGSIPYPQDFENDETDVIVYAKDAKGVVVEETFINMTKEKLASDIPYKCYSLDGGSKWKETTKFTDKQMDAMFKKGMTLAIAEKYDKKTKQPAEGTTIYYFDSISKRPGAPKVKVDYKTYEDLTGFTPGQWTLADKSNNVLDKDELAKYEIGITGSDKKTVSKAGYSSIPVGEGMDFVMVSGKTADTTIYLVRTKATEEAPASKPGKLTVKGQGKAGKIKADYKTEKIKAKKGMVIYFGDTLSADAAELKDEPKSYDDYAGKYVLVDESTAKTGIDISGYITDTRNTVMIWTAATEKKASTQAQVIKLAKRDSIKAAKLSVTDGKLKLDKKYEVYDEAKNKWGALPKITDSCELKIRLKATAKGGSESDSAFAASDSATLKIEYGEYDTTKKKTGIITAEIVKA